MAELFKKAIAFGDIHYGLKQNSRLHLDDCGRYTDWLIATAKEAGAETCLFLGDWSHHRSSINVATMNASIRDLKKLNDNFERVYFITGNHDLFYRDNRELNSVEYIRDLPNIVLVDSLLHKDGVAVVPWLVGNEWKKLAKLKDVRYIFGHFELPFFMMNALVEMPDHGGLNHTHLENAEYVFSGHFHARQSKGNVHYIGNAFPHNYADVGDIDRGCMLLEWGGTPEYRNWPDCPKYKTMMLSELLDNHETLLDEYTYARVKLDINISYEEANFVREKFAEQYNVRELNLLPVKREQEEYEGGEIKFESVDQIVVNQLDTIESNDFDKHILIDIYNGLDI